MMATFWWRQFQKLAWIAYLSTMSFASTASSSWIHENYEAFSSSPWEEGATEGFQHLEHIFVAIPAHTPSKQVFYDLLGFAPDARRLHNLNKGSGTIWANIGISQIHHGVGDPQVVPGTIGLVYDDLTEVISRLKGNKHEALDGTKFAWQERSDGTLEVTCPYGNVLRLHERRAAMQNGSGASPMSTFYYRGGRLPSESSPLGLGIAYAHFRVRPGTAAGLARFYREVLGAETEEMVAGQSADEPACSMAGFDDDERRTKAGVIVRAGPIQHLAFVESEEALPEYDGHHMCLYMTEEGFRRSFLEAERRGLVYTPRPGVGNADTLEKALDEKQFRVKDLVGEKSACIAGWWVIAQRSPRMMIFVLVSAPFDHDFVAGGSIHRGSPPRAGARNSIYFAPVLSRR